jgi:hypothetical protein
MRAAPPEAMTTRPPGARRAGPSDLQSVAQRIGVLRPGFRAYPPPPATAASLASTSSQRASALLIRAPRLQPIRLPAIQSA